MVADNKSIFTPSKTASADKPASTKKTKCNISINSLQNTLQTRNTQYKQHKTQTLIVFNMHFKKYAIQTFAICNTSDMICKHY